MRCDAIIVCGAGQEHNGAAWVPGEPCGRDAVATHEGHGVCWVHLQAVSGPRAGTPNEVKFAGEEKRP